jgi:hypothetical protein
VTAKDAIGEVLNDLAEARQREVLDFVRYLRCQEHREKEEREAWLRLPPGHWDGLYGPDDRGYTEADVKRKPRQ